MRAYLQGLGVTFLVGGLLICLYAVSLVLRDEAFFKAGEALLRHPENLMFKSEYYETLMWHMAYVFVAIVTGLLGLVGSAVLLGLNAVLRRLDQMEASIGRAR